MWVKGLMVHFQPKKKNINNKREKHTHTKITKSDFCLEK